MTDPYTGCFERRLEPQEQKDLETLERYYELQDAFDAIESYLEEYRFLFNYEIEDFLSEIRTVCADYGQLCRDLP